MASQSVERLVPTISLKDFDHRRAEIAKQLVDAAEHTGFFMLVDHGITTDEINHQFDISRAFFALPMEVKGKTPYNMDGLGWEYKAQTRRLTGRDQKESLWLKHGSNWPSDADVPGFHVSTETFMNKCGVISHKLLSCFAEALNFPPNYFEECMNAKSPDSLSRLRMLHYPPANNAPGTWGAGAHTDVGCMTLLFQRDAGDGLEICPGRENVKSLAVGDNYFPVPAKTGPIVVNIGDMLMSWSDDRFKATYHRVRAMEGQNPSRYSIAYFNQGREDFTFQGPLKKYPAITCGKYIQSYTSAQFGEDGNKVGSTVLKGPSFVAVKN